MTKMLKWLLVMFIPLFSLTLASCGDDDEDEPTSYEDLIVGKWRINFSDGYQILTVEKSGKYTAVEIEDGETYTTTGTWSVFDDILIIEYWENGSGGLEKETEVVKILSLTKSKMILLDEPSGDIEEYTRIG